MNEYPFLIRNGYTLWFGYTENTSRSMLFNAPLCNARRIAHWGHPNSPSELSQKGPDSRARIHPPVPYVYLFNVVEILPVSRDAAAAFHAFPAFTDGEE